MSMFCFQCQETVKNKGCTLQGVCGKTEETANLQDLLLYILKGISIYAVKTRELGKNDDEVDFFIAEGLFTTITNVNFDSNKIAQLIDKAFKMRNKVKEIFLISYKDKTGQSFDGDLHDAAVWKLDKGMEDFIKKGTEVGFLSEKNEDVRSLKSLIIFGLKGIAAYTDHAYILGFKDNSILAFLEEALATTLDSNISIDNLTALVIKTGEFGVKALALLDKANTSIYGNPEITEVNTGTKKALGILVSGHDLLDLEELLKQTEGKGINIYTHGEMLPANAYPKLKKYKHLTGNFGSSWYNQQKEFAEFKGAILMTTNCLQKPLESYKDRIFTTGLVAWEGIKHITDRTTNSTKDFSLVIKKALEQGDLDEKPGKKIIIGFAQNAVLSVADKVVENIKSGVIKRFIVMGGCDGRYKDREYFTEVAKQLPKDTVILTAGCTKYRYNMLDLGDINGIPRVLDAGQCNDSYSLAVIALKLAEVFNTKDINDLPISFDIAWYEQKAVIVLLALLYLGFKGIRLGPTIPAFVSSNILKVLVEKFNIKPISNAKDDIEAMIKGN